MRTLIETIIRIQTAASKDPVRYFISGPCIDVVNGKYRVRATDGYSFVQYLTDVDAPKGFVPRIIPSDAIPKLKLMLKNSPKRVTDGFYLTEVSKDRLRFGFGNPEKPVESCDVLCIDGEFPNTDSVAHLSLDAGPRSFEVCLNPELLLNLYKAMNSEKRDQLTTLSFDPTNPMSPILVEHGGVKGLLMPMRNLKKGGDK